MKLCDIAPLEKWLELEKKINARTGLNASVFDVSGVRITEFKRWANRLCPVVKAHEMGQSTICAVAHQNIAAEAMRTRRPVISECDAGLMKLVVPIFIGAAFLGVAGGCGHILENGEVDTFMVSKTVAIAFAKLKALAADVPVMTHKQAEAHAQFIAQEIDHLISAYEKTRSA